MKARILVIDDEKDILDFLCDGKKAKVTVSIGGAMYPQHATDHTALFNQADQALYRAKHSGRNRMDFDPA